MNNTVASHTTQPRSSELRQVLRSHSRVAYHGAILAAAESILLRDGFKRTKMADVAEATGVSVGTLYNYFENKDAVLQAIMDQHTLRLQEQLALPFDSDDPMKQLAQLDHSRSQFHRREPGRVSTVFQSRVRSARISESRSPRFTELDIGAGFSTRSQTARTRSLLGKIRNDIPLDFLAWSLDAALKALLSDWYRNADAFSLTERANEIVSLFFSGARAPA